jgi:hypothetical protein
VFRVRLFSWIPRVVWLATSWVDPSHVEGEKGGLALTRLHWVDNAMVMHSCLERNASNISESGFSLSI